MTVDKLQQGGFFLFFNKKPHSLEHVAVAFCLKEHYVHIIKHVRSNTINIWKRVVFLVCVCVRARVCVCVCARARTCVSSEWNKE